MAAASPHSGRSRPFGNDADPDFVLNQPRYKDAHFLLGGRNFGCGSSREHAVWALAEYGISAVLAPSFAPIFAGNCTRNGIVPVVLASNIIADIAAEDAAIIIDLAAQSVMSASGKCWSFEIGDEPKAMLLEGLDAIDLTWKLRARIEAFQAADQQKRPWIYWKETAA